jgi:hypothetical protein
MGKRKEHKLSKLSDRDEEALSKLSKKERTLAVDGVPDESDVRNLTILFETYDKYTQGRLTRMLEQNKLERAFNGNSAREVSVAKADNLSFMMPQDLQNEVEKYWPTIWSNPKHLRWFLKKFPAFRK